MLLATTYIFLYAHSVIFDVIICNTAIVSVEHIKDVSSLLNSDIIT